MTRYLAVKYLNDVEQWTVPACEKSTRENVVEKELRPNKNENKFKGLI